jgi:hypothetical protein
MSFRVTTFLSIASAALAVAVCALLAAESAQSPPATNQKTDIPSELTDTKNLAPGGLSYLTPLTLQIHRDPPPKYPTWSFKLEKDAWHPGEMIYGRLIVKNEDPQYRFMFLPPWHGMIIDTVEVWFEKLGPDGQPLPPEVVDPAVAPAKAVEKNVRKQLTRAWPFFKILSPYTIRAGVPVILEPGQTCEALIPVNSYWSDSMGNSDHRFYGASVMNQPGQYRFYIRYLNRHHAMVLPRGDSIRKPQAGRVYQWPGELEKIPKFLMFKESRNPAIEVPEDFIILGPFNVKIEPWPTEGQNNAAEKVVEIWDHIEGPPTDCIMAQPAPDPQRVKEVLKAFPASRENPCSIGAMQKLHSWIATRRYADCMNFDGREGMVSGDEITKRLKIMLEDLRAMKADEKPGILRDLMTYWEVRTLIDLGKRSEALKAARENPTPDIIALIGARIGLAYNENWHENAAPYAIPADNYTDPSLLPTAKSPALEDEPMPATAVQARPQSAAPSPPPIAEPVKAPAPPPEKAPPQMPQRIEPPDPSLR